MKHINNEETVTMPMSEYKRLKTLEKEYSDKFDETGNVLVMQYMHIPTIAEIGVNGVYICDKQSVIGKLHERIGSLNERVGQLARENLDLRIKSIRDRKRWWHF